LYGRRDGGRFFEKKLRKKLYTDKVYSIGGEKAVMML